MEGIFGARLDDPQAQWSRSGSARSLPGVSNRDTELVLVVQDWPRFRVDLLQCAEHGSVQLTFVADID